MKQSRFLIYIVFLWSLFCSSAWATVYNIDSQQSYFHILTGRAGPLKAFSHRHVIELGPLTGQIQYQPQGTSTTELVLSPADFLVDRPETTARYPDIWGEETVKESAAKGTRKNMLSKKLLDAEDFPVITVDINLKQQKNTVFEAVVTIKGQSFTFQIPGQLTVNENDLTAIAEFTLTHEQLGLKPFKAMGGAIAVGDEIHFLVHIVATAADQ
ncbi:YceI family protein [Gynuella sp.]|uniref:YceI family protein n=1 Tax=Gynuella sp. TaxID=2969146 RepID=UPI003D1459F0